MGQPGEGAQDIKLIPPVAALHGHGKGALEERAGGVVVRLEGEGASSSAAMWTGIICVVPRYVWCGFYAWFRVVILSAVPALLGRSTLRPYGMAVWSRLGNVH
jgi:hypothetical protein